MKTKNEKQPKKQFSKIPGFISKERLSLDKFIYPAKWCLYSEICEKTYFGDYALLKENQFEFNKKLFCSDNNFLLTNLKRYFKEFEELGYIKKVKDQVYELTMTEEQKIKLVEENNKIRGVNEPPTKTRKTTNNQEVKQDVKGVNEPPTVTFDPPVVTKVEPLNEPPQHIENIGVLDEIENGNEPLNEPPDEPLSNKDNKDIKENEDSIYNNCLNEIDWSNDKDVYYREEENFEECDPFPIWNNEQEIENKTEKQETEIETKIVALNNEPNHPIQNSNFNNSNLPWLDFGTTEYKNAVQQIKNGTNPDQLIKELRNNFKINKKTIQFFNDEYKKTKNIDSTEKTDQTGQTFSYIFKIIENSFNNPLSKEQLLNLKFEEEGIQFYYEQMHNLKIDINQISIDDIKLSGRIAVDGNNVQDKYYYSVLLRLKNKIVNQLHPAVSI